MIIWFLKFIFFEDVLHLIAHYTDFEVFIIFRIIHVVWCVIKIRGVFTRWGSRVLAYLYDMLPSPAHVNRVLIRHFNLLNTASLIDLNFYLISGRQCTLIKHTATAHGRFFFNRSYPPSVFNRLLHYARYLPQTRWFQWSLVVIVSFNIWLRISTHVFDPKRPPANLNHKSVFDNLLLRPRLVRWHYLLLAHLQYSPVSIRLGISTSLLVVLNNNDLRTAVWFLIILLSMKKHPWHSGWRSHWLI